MASGWNNLVVSRAMLVPRTNLNLPLIVKFRLKADWFGVKTAKLNSWYRLLFVIFVAKVAKTFGVVTIRNSWRVSLRYPKLLASFATLCLSPAFRRRQNIGSIRLPLEFRRVAIASSVCVL